MAGTVLMIFKGIKGAVSRALSGLLIIQWIVLDMVSTYLIK
jgi:hypothetical protein